MPDSHRPPGYGPPITAPAEEMARHFSRWADAAREQPVVVTRHRRPNAVIVAPEQFEAWRKRDAAGDTQIERRFEASLAMVLDHTTEGFFACDDELKVLSANSVFETLVGQPESQLWGRPVDEIFGREQGTILRELLVAVLNAREVAELELRSEERTLLVRGFPYPTGVAALVLNRSRELALRQRCARHQAVNRALGELPNLAQIELNLRGVIQTVGPAFEAMVGFSDKELKRFRLAEIVQPKARPEFNQAFEAALAGGPSLIRTTLLAMGGAQLVCDLSIAIARRDDLAEAIVVLIVPASEEGKPHPTDAPAAPKSQRASKY